MSDPASAQKIIKQDNAHIQALLDKLDKAQEARDQAGAAWEADTQSKIASDNLTEAIAVYSQVADELARLLRSLWKAGYRLTRE